MEEKLLIYVAGNPNGYPLEYYDPDTKTFKGVIPSLLEDFSEQSGYEIVYYQADGKDHRTEFAKNYQTDLLSGYMPGDEIPTNIGSAFLFQTDCNGETYDYLLYFTLAAPEAFQAQLTDYLSGLSKEQITGLVLDAASVPRSRRGFYLITAVLAALILILTVGILLLRRFYRKKLSHETERLQTDETTGLGNIEYLTRYYNQYVNDKNRVLYQLIYFHVGMDRLRRVGSCEEADDFLRYCGAVLNEYAQDSDILAKISDDGFVLLKLAGSNDSLDQWIRIALDRLRSYASMNAKPFETNVYAGIYPLRAQDKNLDEMIFQAAYGAKAAMGRGEEYIICTRETAEKIAEERQLQASIDQALTNHEFQLYIQFFVDAHTHRVVGGEALSRWNHPQKGLLTPGIFIPMMEREKLISRLDYYNLNQTCIFLENLYKEKEDSFFISCNCSRATFVAEDFVKQTEEILSRYTFPKEQLILEITESSYSGNIEQIRKNMLAVKKYGVRIALDDFGAGFTSISELQKYPFDTIKLDKCLVDNIMAPAGTVVLKAVVQAGHELNMALLAEGVEEDEQAILLRDIGCDFIQGFRFSHPLPEWEAYKQVKNRQKPEKAVEQPPQTEESQVSAEAPVVVMETIHKMQDCQPLKEIENTSQQEETSLNQEKEKQTEPIGSMIPSDTIQTSKIQAGKTQTDKAQTPPCYKAAKTPPIQPTCFHKTLPSKFTNIVRDADVTNIAGITNTLAKAVAATLSGAACMALRLFQGRKKTDIKKGTSKNKTGRKRR